MTQSDKQQHKQSFKDDFLNRINGIKMTRWIRFSIVAVLFIAWMIWLGEWWPAIFLVLLFDI